MCLLLRVGRSCWFLASLFVIASPTQWTWVWANSERSWRTGKHGKLQSMGSERVRHDLVTEQQLSSSGHESIQSHLTFLCPDVAINSSAFCSPYGPSLNMSVHLSYIFMNVYVYINILWLYWSFRRQKVRCQSLFNILTRNSHIDL